MKDFDCMEHNKKEMGIPDHLICLLRNLYASQEALVRPYKQIVQNWERNKQGCVL